MIQTPTTQCTVRKSILFLKEAELITSHAKESKEMVFSSSFVTVVDDENGDDGDGA